MYREIDVDVSNLAEGAALTSLLLAAQHVLLWDMRDRLPITARYAAGTAAIGCGVAWIAWRRRDWGTLLAWLAPASLGGSLVFTAHLLRNMQEQPADRIIRLALEGNRRGIRRTAP